MFLYITAYCIIKEKIMTRINNKQQPLNYKTGKFKSGKYSGYRLDKVPVTYISWVLHNWEGLSLKSIMMLNNEILKHS